MNQSLKKLIKISRQVGKDPGLTCGASGNTSVKTLNGKFMFVKASGTALAKMNEKKGWCKINLQKVREIIKDKKLEKLSSQKREAEVGRQLLAACEGKRINQPSVETNLHAFLDRYVIHLHPIAVSVFVSAKNGRAEIEKLFAGEKFPHLWVPYANPGFALAKKIANLSSRYQKKYGQLPQILFLEKHGLFVSAPTAKEAIKLVERVIKRCETKVSNPAIVMAGIAKPKLPGKIIKNARQIIRTAFFEATGQRQPVHFFNNKIISTFANSENTGRLLKAGSLNPHEIAYCSGSIVWSKKPQKNKIMPHFKKDNPPSAFLVKEIGLFVIGGRKSALTAMQVVCDSLFVRYNAQRFGGTVAMTKPEQDYIRNFGA